MSQTVRSRMIQRVYVENDQSYPTDESLPTRQVFLEVLSNLMGDLYQDNMIQWADDIRIKLEEYRKRLQKEKACYNTHPSNKQRIS